MIIKFFITICMVLLGTLATAQEKYPSKPITFIIPWPAGGTADASMRAIGESLSKNLGVPVIVENRSGASGMLGVSQLVASKPDGYTIGQIPLSITRQHHIGTINFNPLIFSLNKTKSKKKDNSINKPLISPNIL